MVRRPGQPDSHPELPDDPDPGPLDPRLLALVGVGGAIGTLARYGLARWLPAGAGWPRGTMIANLAGALVLGVLLEALTRSGPDDGPRQRLRLLLGTGFCGGLTTYSTFAVETVLLAKAHHDALAVGYVVTTIVAGFALAAAGIGIASHLHRRRA
jgi:fluoride exporter